MGYHYPSSITIVAASSLSLAGALVIFLTFYVNKVWRIEFDSKFVLFMMSIYIVGYSLSYIAFIDSNLDNSSSLSCTLQACLIQYFGVGIMLHEAMIAYDLFDTVEKLARGQLEPNLTIVTMEVDNEDQSRSTILLTYFKKIPFKYIAFELFVFVFNMVGAICLHKYNNASNKGPGTFSLCELC